MALIKKIKNADTVNHTYQGQVIVPAAYFEIPEPQWLAWSNDSTLLSDIGSGIAVVNDGTSDIADVSTAINTLKGLLPLDIIPRLPVDSTKQFFGFSCRFTATKNSETTHDFLFPAKDLALHGGFSYMYGTAHASDNITVKVIDIDNVLGLGANTVLATYVDKWGVIPGTTMVLDSGITTPLPAQGLYFRVVYDANDSLALTDPQGFINMITYEVL